MSVIPPRRRLQGLTLVEMLVALVMGLVLLAGVATIFVGNKESYRFQEALARTQENGRFALALLEREVRAAGHWGCTSLRGVLPKVVVTSPGSGQFRAYDRPVFAFEWQSPSTWSPALDSASAPPWPWPTPPYAGTAALPGSDVLMLRVADQHEYRVKSHGSATADVVVHGDAFEGGMRSGNAVLVSDCDASAIFQLTSNPSASGGGASRQTTLAHGGQDLGKQFPSAGSTAEAQQIRNTAYFVAPTGITTDPADRMALWRWDGVTAEELVEGVDRFEVRFGVDTSTAGDETVDLYETAAQVQTNGRWDRVLSVRVTLVVSGSDLGVTPNNQSVDINLDGDTLDAGEAPTDRRLRQVYTATISLRNRQS